MSIILSFFPEFGPAAHAFWLFFSNGGFLLFVILAVVLLKRWYMNTINGNWKANQKWVFLSIKVPRENLTSTLAVEQIYSQLHAAHRSMTMAEKYIEGRVQLWYSFEIVSLGGKISFIVRSPLKFRDTVEAAFYAQYPDAEISEVADYLENFHYDPEDSEYEIFGTEMKMRESDVFPIKTYKDLEHTSAEVKIIDPIAPLLEALSKIDTDEFLAVQILAQPLGDPEWQDKAQKKAKVLLGEEVHHGEGFIHELKKFIGLFSPIKILLMFVGAGGGKGSGHEKQQRTNKNDLLSMTEVEKEQVNGIQAKATKPGYMSKIRFLYMAPREKYDRSRRAAVVGAFRTLSKTHGNSLKPDSKEVATRVKYRISKTLEQPYMSWLETRRKHHFFEGWKLRNYYIGLPQYILNTEELATLFHLPITAPTSAADVSRIESKKSQAPVNLPIGDF
jgi:hypothetical protein